ncbi:phage baseplate assembly protein V [uncultured Apibacter sp.]|uniref:type VI secretion system Vgr family protein n=1 Tax=uncultured Apibacter sp. TaxID=1778616 RepID=UPI0025FA014B|nr:phage baseplate assembly protein V [uncultured Apibacter sp.]
MEKIDKSEVPFTFSSPDVVKEKIANKFNRYGKTSITYVSVKIAGEDYFTETNIAKLEIKQKVGDHHSFEIWCDPGEFNEDNAYLFENSRAHLGKRITFQFHRFGTVQSIFTGLITQVSTQKQDGVKKVILRGNSPSILMENGLHTRSFENKTLEEIIKEVAYPYAKNLIDFKINPNFKEKIPYIVQYNESDYQFIKRLASRFGEYYYYNGEQLVFSAWGGKITELAEEEDIFNFELKMEVHPQKFSYTAYDAKQSSDYKVDSESQRLQQSENPFQQYAINASEGLFNVSPTAHFDKSLLINQQLDIERAVLAEKRKRQNLVYIEATTNEPSLRLGDIGKVSAWIPKHKIFKSGKIPIESYKINEIIHCFVEGEGYTNTFIGVPKDLITPPDYDGSNSPVADIQHAIVTDNKDPKKMGRVRLQFVWQKAENSQTPWVQVIQPHAGRDKGTYINPEIGETVLVAFQGGNAEAPIVLGTAYNGGEIAAYYTEGNDIKVIQTRSGAKIIFNDAEGQGSILIEDPSGNRIFLDGKGNIRTEVPETFFLDAKNVVVTASQNISMSAGENISIMAAEDYNLAASNIYESAGEGRVSNANDFIEISKKSTYTSNEDKINLESALEVKSNSAQQTSLH